MHTTKEYCGKIPYRSSPASAWPLRPAGSQETFAERKQRENAK